MGINIAAAGYGYPNAELPQDRSTSARAQARRSVEASLPEQGPVVNLDKTTKQLVKISLAFDKKLKFVVNQDLNEVIVKVIDPDTDKVIKEIPSEELQRLHLKIKEMIGLLFDERV